VEERLGGVIVRGVADGIADIGILEAAVDTAGLQRLEFRADRLVLVVPRGHPLAAAGRRRVSIRAAVPHGVIGLAEGSALQMQWDAALAQRGLRLNYRTRVPSADAQCRLVAGGAGIALMAEAAARRLGPAARLRILRLSEPEMTRQLVLCVRDLEALPAYVQALVTHLRQAPQPR